MLDQARPPLRFGSSIGQGVTRHEGQLKVTGAAAYAADNRVEGMLYAVLCGATIACGRVVHLDVEAAKAHPGVVEVMVPENRPPLAGDPDAKPDVYTFRMDLLQSNRVRYANQAIAVVVAETLEAATEGAVLLAPRYEVLSPHVGLDSNEHFVPATVGEGEPNEEAAGSDVDEAFGASLRRISPTYETPAQYHNPMEPHAILAQWDGDRLALDMPSQAITFVQARVAGLLGIDPADITVRSPFLGGGFGCKAFITGPQVLGILAAKLTGRPVKLVLRRDQMYGPVGHRAPTRQTLRIGADEDGTLEAIHHHCLTATSSFDEFFEPAHKVTHVLYATPALKTTHTGVRVDTGTPLFMRAPGEAPGSFALECAMDEMADAVGVDPLEFRLKNYAEVEPISGKPFSSKSLRECYRLGADAFGWSSRVPAPRSMRDRNGMLVGYGMGTATFPMRMFAADARVTLRADGSGLLEIGAHDMGQGAITALTQVAADSICIELSKLDIRVGHSDLPSGGLAGGSGGMATTGNAVHAAGQNVVAQLARLATGDPESPLFGAGNMGVIARDGHLVRRDAENRGESYAAILARAGLPSISGNGSAADDAMAHKRYAMHAHGAVFAEVKVDPELGQVRCTRLVGAFAAGRIINSRMVRSQYFGGMVWGMSFVLHEEAMFDPRSGRLLNANLGEYYVPTNADVPSLQAILVDEHDDHVNALGIKGVGEIGITGSAGAVANAVYHATGIRIRKLPVRLDSLLDGATDEAAVYPAQSAGSCAKHQSDRASDAIKAGGAGTP